MKNKEGPQRTENSEKGKYMPGYQKLKGMGGTGRWRDTETRLKTSYSLLSKDRVWKPVVLGSQDLVIENIFDNDCVEINKLI